MHQSRRLLVQSSCRADPAQSGNQVTRPTSSTIFGLTSATLRNHWTVARNRIGVLHRQQWPYAWTIVSSANSAWAARRSATIRGFASLTLWPAYVPASSVKRPRASTGEKAGRPSFSPVEDRKSTRLNSSHGYISYAVFCLKKKKKQDEQRPQGV